MDIMMRYTYLALVSFALLLGMSSCDSSGSSTDDPSPTGDSSTPPPSSAARKVEFDGDRHGCRYGGVLVQTGIDDNSNGTLDDDEVDASEAVCNGAPGADGATGDNGLTSLIKRTVLLAEDANCPAGGEFVETGIDDDGNGTLEAEEVDASAYLCNNPALLYAEETNPLALRLEACPLGGTDGHYGTDDNGNGTLDAEEIDISLPVDCNTEVGLVWEDDEAATDRWPARQGHSSVVFDGKLWVIGGAGSGERLDDVWSSTDGINWTQETSSAGWSAREGHSSVVFDGKLWVLGGDDGGDSNEVWSSEDGATWTQVTISGTSWSARQYHTSGVFDGKLWVIGGSIGGTYLDDVWSSPDGVTWAQATTAATHWSARYRHSSAVFDSKLWVIGGYDGSSRLNDAWSSSDGSTWTEATAAAGWSARSGHSSVVHAGKLWVIGGDAGGGSVRLDDVWSSSDGATWTDETPSETHWPVRRYHTSAVFDGYIWVLGGQTTGSTRFNDVWVFAP